MLQWDLGRNLRHNDSDRAMRLYHHSNCQLGDPSDQISTIGLSASSIRPVKPTTTGKYIFTKTDIVTSGLGTTITPAHQRLKDKLVL